MKILMKKKIDEFTSPTTKEYLKNSISLKLQSVFANEFCILQKLNLHIWKKIKCLYWYIICVCAAYILPYDSPELIGFVWLALLSRLAGNYVFVCIFYYLLKLHYWAQAMEPVCVPTYTQETNCLAYDDEGLESLLIRFPSIIRQR